MTIPKTFDESFTSVRELAERFKDNESAYLSPKYIEQEVRDQFLDPSTRADRHRVIMNASAKSTGHLNDRLLRTL